MQYWVNVEIEGFSFRIQVNLINKGEEHYYIVREPRCSEECLEAKRRAMEMMRRDGLDPVSAIKSINHEGEPLRAALYYLLRDLRGYGKVTVPLWDPEVEEVELNNWSLPVTVIHREYPGLRLISNIRFNDEVEAREFIMNMSKRGLPRALSLAKPYLETILPEGHRFTGTIGEITIGPTFSIRKFPTNPMTLEELVEKGSLSPSVAAYLWLLLEYRGFLVISGPMGSGKTTLVSALVGKLPWHTKVVTIEDTPEVKVPQPNWVRMFTRDAEDSKINVDMFSLVRLAVRYRPDHIVVGEVRGEEVHALFQASALGHGMITTFHASTPEEFLVRLTNPPLNVPPGNLSLIWAIAFTGIRNGRRLVVNVVEPRVVNGKVDFVRVMRSDSELDVNASTRLRELEEVHDVDAEAELRRRINMIKSHDSPVTIEEE
jgi:flagellar protein FlaI